MSAHRREGVDGQSAIANPHQRQRERTDAREQARTPVQEHRQQEHRHQEHSSRFAHNARSMAIRPGGIQADWPAMPQSPMASAIAQPLRPLSNRPPSTPNAVCSTTAASPYTAMAPAQVLGDVGAVAQFNQVYNVMSQRRSEASLMLSDSFRWDNAILTNQGLPLVGMAFCLESHGHDESVESQQRSTYQRSEELDDELSWNPSTTRPGLVSERGHHSGHGYSDDGLYASPHGQGKHVAGQQASALGHAVDRMVESLDQSHQRTIMGWDVGGCGLGVPIWEAHSPQTTSQSRGTPDANRIQEHPPGAHSQQSSFICPYAMRYPDRVNHYCFQRLDTISYVKQHLRHRHHSAGSCPHQCLKRRSRPPIQQTNATLCYDADTCLLINKQRCDRKKTHRQQWARIYEILFDEENCALDPVLEDLTVRRLRGFFQFMEKHGSECLAPAYNQLPREIRLVYPEPEVVYRIAFCTWLPRAFERFLPHGQRLLGGFLNQIESTLRGSSYPPAHASGRGLASRENAPSPSPGHQVEQQGGSPWLAPRLDAMPIHQPHYHAVPTHYPAQQQSNLQDFPLLFGSEYEYHYGYPYFPVPTQPPTDADSVAFTPSTQDLEYQFDSHDSHDVLFDQCSPMFGSPSQILEGMEMEDIGPPQTLTGEFKLDLDI